MTHKHNGLDAERCLAIARAIAGETFGNSVELEEMPEPSDCKFYESDLVGAIFATQWKTYKVNGSRGAAFYLSVNTSGDCLVNLFWCETTGPYGPFNPSDCEIYDSNRIAGYVEANRSNLNEDMLAQEEDTSDAAFYFDYLVYAALGEGRFLDRVKKLERLCAKFRRVAERDQAEWDQLESEIREVSA